MNLAKTLGTHALLAVLGVAGGKVEPDIPWWVVFAGTIILACGVGVLVTHLPRRDPASVEDIEKLPSVEDIEKLPSVEDIEKLFDVRLLRIQEFKAALATLPKKPLGADGTTVAKLPPGTNAVTLPSGEVRLALPVPIVSRASTTISSDTPTLTIDKPDAGNAKESKE